MMSEEEIRKELAMGNIVCPECSDSLMNFEYDENDNCIYVCPKCGYDIEAENYDYFFSRANYTITTNMKTNPMQDAKLVAVHILNAKHPAIDSMIKISRRDW